jgi:hypothetical protein
MEHWNHQACEGLRAMGLAGTIASAAMAIGLFWLMGSGLA